MSDDDEQLDDSDQPDDEAPSSNDDAAADPGAPRPPRRPRYAGKNPRQFHEKYKELQPERYADDVAKVLASGKTPAGTHRPIMVREILEVLAPRPGDTAVDATLGYGGHARELLAAVQSSDPAQPGGRLIAVDADPLELPKTEARLRALGFPAESLIVRRMNYAGLAQLLAAEVIYSETSEVRTGADCILADLGLSSMQLDDPARGFTYKADGPLDMRMNPSRGLSAAELLAKLAAEERGAAKLAQLLTDNADEPQARPLAEALVAAQQHRPITTTHALVEAVRDRMERIRHTTEDEAENSVRRVFQALRIEVNDEFSALDTFLRRLPECLNPGGRVAILSFHSGEDRRVKKSFQQYLAAGLYSKIAEDITRPGPEEQRNNPRSSAAKLRWAVRAE